MRRTCRACREITVESDANRNDLLPCCELSIESDVLPMMHEDIMLSQADLAAGHDLRRTQRVPCPAEVTLVWHHNPGTVVRYRVLDVSDGGLRLRSSVPLLEGTTGMIMRMLPQGTPIEKAVMVVWSHDAEAGGYAIGVRYL
jgi:hypothetical protein